jgi:hypothetical protein
MLLLIAAGGTTVAVVKSGDRANSSPVVTELPRSNTTASSATTQTSGKTASTATTPTTKSTAVGTRPPVSPVDPFTSSAARSFLAGRHDDITAAVYDIGTGQTYTYQPGVAQQTASVVKVDILETLLWQLQKDSESIGGVEDEQAEGMIEESDNDDATDLWDDDGGAAGVQSYDSAVGLADTDPNYHWGETTTTALDQLHLLKLIVFPNPYLDQASRSFELNLMEHVVGWEDWGVSSGPAGHATVALKNGWVPITDGNWQINSIGYVDGSGRQYLLAVLSDENPDENYGITSVEGISSIVWNELAPGT